MRFFIIFLFLFSPLFSDLQTDLKEHIVVHKKGENLIGHIYIGGHESNLDQATWIYVKNALDYYKKKGAIFIILELNTPGGDLYATQKIADVLKTIDVQYGIPVVAYINNWALSSSVMLVYSSRFITTVKEGIMGAVPTTDQKLLKKVHSSVRTDFGNRATLFNRNPLVAQSMADPILTLVLRKDAIYRILKDEEIQPDDKLIVANGQLLTLNAKEMIEYKVADILLEPATLVPITEQEKKEGRWPFSKELLSKAPFFDQIQNGVVIDFQKNWKTHFLSFLSSPLINALLFLICIVAFYIELSTLRFGLAGVVGILSLVLIIFASYATELYSLFEIILLVSGIGLILVEIFLTPTFKVAGILGTTLSTIALILLLLPGIQEFRFDFENHTLNPAGEFLLQRIIYLGLAFLAALIIIILINRFNAPKLFLFSSLVLKESDKKEAMYFNLPHVGDLGVVHTPLRKEGKIMIKDEIFDAVSAKGFIDVGVNVKVISVVGDRVVVEEVK